MKQVILIAQISSDDIYMTVYLEEEWKLWRDDEHGQGIGRFAGQGAEQGALSPEGLLIFSVDLLRLPCYDGFRS